jgi:hypothetical protein
MGGRCPHDGDRPLATEAAVVKNRPGLGRLEFSKIFEAVVWRVGREQQSDGVERCRMARWLQQRTVFWMIHPYSKEVVVLRSRKGSIPQFGGGGS